MSSSDGYLSNAWASRDIPDRRASCASRFGIAAVCERNLDHGLSILAFRVAGTGICGIPLGGDGPGGSARAGLCALQPEPRHNAGRAVPRPSGPALCISGAASGRAEADRHRGPLLRTADRRHAGRSAAAADSRGGCGVRAGEATRTLPARSSAPRPPRRASTAAHALRLQLRRTQIRRGRPDPDRRGRGGDGAPGLRLVRGGRRQSAGLGEETRTPRTRRGCVWRQAG